MRRVNAFSTPVNINGQVPTSFDGGVSVNANITGPITTQSVTVSSANGTLSPIAVAAVAGQRIFKNTAGNLYGFNGTTGAVPGYFMVYNSATSVADGASTPIKVWAVGSSASIEVGFNVPIRFSTGITIAFSNTGPFTKTESNTVFMSADFV